MLVDTERMLGISEANSRGLSKLVQDAEIGRECVLMRNSKPVAAVVPFRKLERLDELETVEDDLRLLAITLTRVLTDSGHRSTFDDVLAHFGLDEADLVTADDQIDIEG